MATDNVAQLERDIHEKRTAYLGLRDKLVSALAPFAPPADMVDHLISMAEETGPAQAVKTLGDDPTFFGVEVPPEVRRDLSPLVLSIVDTSYALDGLVARRENILAKADPTRKRVYVHFGREFIIDERKGTMTFLDDPDHPVALNMQAVPTKDQPTRGRPFIRQADDKDAPTR